MNVGQDQLPTIAHLCTVIIERLEKTVAMQNQVVSMDDKNTLEEMQTSLASVLMSIIQRLDKEIKPQGDRVMQALFGILSSAPGNSIVPDAVFGTVGSLANALEEDFTLYMEAFAPFLYTALGNEQEQQLCSLAIGLVSDIARSIQEKVTPYCDNFMNLLLNNLKVKSIYFHFRFLFTYCARIVEFYIESNIQTCNSSVFWRHRPGNWRQL